MIILLSAYVSGTLIHGTIYDISLNKVNNVKVMIDTQPNQLFISKNGTYSFNVPVGSYKIRAEKYIKEVLVSSVEENISITNEGDYVVDLILFPNIDDENELLKEPDVTITDDYFEKPAILPYIFLFLFFAGIILFIIYKKLKKSGIKPKTESEPEKIMPSDLGDIMKIIEEEGGRTTQKEIRKKIPLSEAKISLMISELEHKGLIEKIKKGRGNIIIKKGG